MMSETRLFVLSAMLAFLASFGGAHLLADLLIPATEEARDLVLLLLRQATR
jgi:hypothetical protein